MTGGDLQIRLAGKEFSFGPVHLEIGHQREPLANAKPRAKDELVILTDAHKALHIQTYSASGGQPAQQW